MMTTVTYAYAQVGAGRTRHQVRTDAFHANSLCGRPADRVLSDRDAEKLRDCTRCVKAREAADAQAAEIVEAPAAPAAETDRPATITTRVVEGVVVSHNGTARGSLPKHTDNPDVHAALAALKGLHLAVLTDEGHEEATDYGYMVEPRGDGRVAVYWVRACDIVEADGRPFRVELQIARDRLADAGWLVEAMSRNCVFAWTPGSVETAPAEPAGRPAAVEAPAETEQPAAPAPAPAMNAVQARAAVIEAFPDARRFEIHRGTGGELLGYTFQVDRLHATQYGWVTPAATCARTLERQRSEARAMLPAQVADDRRTTDRAAARAAVATLPLDQAKRTALRSHPNAQEFRACKTPAGEFLGWTFKAGSRFRAVFGWVNADGTLGQATESYRGTIEDMLVKYAELNARPALPKRTRDPQRDAELTLLRGLLGEVRTAARHGDMDDIRRALADFDQDIDHITG